MTPWRPRLERRPVEPRAVVAVGRVDSLRFHTHLRPDRFISESLLRREEWEPFESLLFRRCITSGAFVCDIGAWRQPEGIVQNLRQPGRRVPARGHLAWRELDLLRLRLLPRACPIVERLTGLGTIQRASG